MRIRERIIRNFAGVLISEAIGKGSLFIANMILARRLGVDGFGLLVLAQTIASSLWIGADLGTSLYGIREVARRRAGHGIVGPLMGLKIVSGFTFFCLYTAVILYFFSALQFEKKLVFILCGLYLLAYPLYFDWIFKGMENFLYLGLATLAYGLFSVVSVLMLVKTSSDIVIASALWSFSYLIGGTCLFLILRVKLQMHLNVSLNFRLWLIHLSNSIHFLFSGLASMIYAYVPIFFIGYALNQHDVGIFSAAYKIVLVVSAPAYYVSMAFFPIISNLYGNDLRSYKRLDKIMFILYGIGGVIVASICFLFARQIIFFACGSAYQASVTILKVVIWVLPLQFLRYKFSQFIASTEYQRLQIIANLSALLFYLIYFTFAGFTLTSIAASIIFGETILVVAYMVLWRFVCVRTQ